MRKGQPLLAKAQLSFPSRRVLRPVAPVVDESMDRPGLPQCGIQSLVALEAQVVARMEGVRLRGHTQVRRRPLQVHRLGIITS